MRKCIAFFIILLSVYKANGQENNYIPQIISPTPQASMFDKYINHKVNLYNGIPEITIPLGEIALEGLTIPIFLSYHASGIKYLSFDGEVGAGWSLNIGNYRISRTINGKCDFEVPKRFDENEYNKLSNEDPYGAELYRWGMYYFKNSRGNDKSFEESIDYNVDPEYDFFTFNIPAKSGKFLLLEDPNNKSQSRLGTSIGESNNEIIDVSPNEASIRDAFGNYFGFGRNPSSGGEFITEKYWDRSTFQLDNYKTVGWPLTSISSSLHESANFFYKEYKQHNTRHSHQKYWSFSIHNAPAVGTPNGESANTEASFSSETENTSSLHDWYYKVYSLDRIESTHMDVFIHRIDGEQLGNTPSLIRAIEFKDKSGRLLKTVDFKYNFDEPSTDKKMFLHYMLESVTIDSRNNSPEEYSFDYYGSSYKRSKGNGPDLWGFYINPGMNISNDPRYGSTDIYIDKNYKEDEYYNWYTHSSFGNILTQIFHSRKLKELPNLFLDSYRIAFTDRSTNNNPHVFSLKRITYPAGGHTEYEYEPNGKGMGGMRIKRIKSVSGDYSPDFISTYTYGAGMQNFLVDHHSYKDSKVHFGSSEGMSPYFSSFCTIDTYSSNIRDYIPFSNYSVTYRDVTEKNQIYKGNTIESNGSTVYEYTIPQVYNIGYLPEEIIRSAPPKYKYNTLKRGGSEYRTGYSPTLKSKKQFSKDNELIQAEYYNYIDSHPKNKQNILSLNAIKLDRVISTSFSGYVNNREKYRKGSSINWDGWNETPLPYDIMCDYSYFRSFFGKMVYSINLGGKTLLKEKILSSYNKGSSPIVKKESYDYDDLDRLTKVTFTNSAGYSISEENFYPTKAHNPAFDYMNMKSIVLKTQTKVNDKLTKEIERIYPVDYKDYELMLPIKIVTRNTDGSAPETEVSFKYADHNKVKIEQYTGKDGESVTYLWSYNGRYPIAEIKNANYEDLVSAVRAVFYTNISGVSKLSTIALDQLKKLQTNSLLQNAMISLYTYKPHIGMETFTDPRGNTTFYNLDNSGRLIDIKDSKGNVISEYSYVYRNRQEGNINIELLWVNSPHIGVNNLIINSNNTRGSYAWIIRDSSDNIVASGNTSNITHSFTPGEYYIDYSVTDKSTNNIFSDTEKIEVKPLSAEWKNQPILEFSRSVIFSCLGIGGSGKYQYNWSLKNKQGNLVNTQTGSNNTYEYLIPEGEYTADCTVADLITKERVNLPSHKLYVKPAYMELKHDWLMVTDKGLTNGIAKFMIDISGGGGYQYYSFSWQIKGEGITYDVGDNDIEVYAELPSKSGDYYIECTVKDALYNNEQTFTYNIQVVDEILEFSHILNATKKASAKVEIKSLTDLQFSIGYSGDRIPNGSYANYKISHSNGNTLVNKRITSSDLGGPDIVLKNIPSGTLYIEMEPDYQRYLEIECSIHMHLLNPTSEKIIGTPSSLYFPKKP